MVDLQQILDGRPAPSRSVIVTAVVTRSTEAAVYAVPIGGDRRAPLGPCRGGRHTTMTTTTAGDGSHTHELITAPLPVGTVVLLVLTTGAPWIAAHDIPGGP